MWTVCVRRDAQRILRLGEVLGASTLNSTNMHVLRASVCSERLVQVLSCVMNYVVLKSRILLLHAVQCSDGR